MPFDYKKEYNQFYMPKNVPEIVNIPKRNYIAVKGKGDPNDEYGDYKKALKILYAIAFTLKMSYKSNYKIDGYFEYVVPPLEGFWWQDGIANINYERKKEFNWISIIRLPDFITKQSFEWAKNNVETKKKIDCSSAEFLTIDEGLCVQIMHIGSYDNEPESVAKMHEFAQAQGYEADISDKRKHHEIYLSDPRKTSFDKLKTIIRHPIK